MVGGRARAPLEDTIMPSGKPIDHAHATIRITPASDAGKITASRTVVQGVLGSVNIGKAPDVEAAANKWSANIDALEANAKAIANLKVLLKAGEATQRTLRRAWAAGKKQVTISVDTFCEGSADLVHAFTLDVITQGGAAGDEPWPSDLAAAPGHAPGEVAASWSRPLITGRHFVVQWATAPANPATASPNIAYTKTRFVLPDQTSGDIIHFRVAYQDSSLPEGHGPWSAWVGGTVK
jgi:hypothetical protein